MGRSDGGGAGGRKMLFGRCVLFVWVCEPEAIYQLDVGVATKELGSMMACACSPCK